MVNDLKRKTTFNLNDRTHQGLKFAAASQNREMGELLEEALSGYLGWNMMTNIEKDELELERIADREGAGRWNTTNFGTLQQQLGHVAESEIVAQLLVYVNASELVNVFVWDGQAYRPVNSFPDGTDCLYKNGGQIKLQLTIPGRRRFEQLQARLAWENFDSRLGRWIEKAAAFRAERVAAIENGRFPVALEEGPKVVMHIIPLESFGTNASHTIFGLNGVYPMYWTRLSAWGPRINMDGMAWISAGDHPQAYTQIYRHGVIEAVRVGLLRGLETPELIPSLSYEEAVVQYVPHCLQILKQLGCTAPIMIGISLIGTKGLRMAGATSTTIDRDTLVLPEIILENFSTKPAPLLKPALDLVWNACGSAGSLYFDETGNWVGRQSINE